MKKTHPEFAIGNSMKGIITDWSDTQLKGIQAAIGEGNANQIVKGCQVRKCIQVQV